MVDSHQDGASLDVKGRRAALRCELAAIGHWRRVIRARIDLTVARGVTPQKLDSEFLRDHPKYISLNADLENIRGVPSEAFPLGFLPELRGLDERLAAYERELTYELESLAGRLVKEVLDSSNSHAIET